MTLRSGRRVTTMQHRWLLVDEIATYLGVKRETVYRWTVKKLTPVYRAGRLWKFRVSQVDAWVETGKADDGPAAQREQSLGKPIWQKA